MKQIASDYFTLTDEADFKCRSLRFRYDREQQAVVLQRNDSLRLPSTDKTAAETLLAGQRPGREGRVAEAGRLAEDLAVGVGSDVLLDGLGYLADQAIKRPPGHNRSRLTSPEMPRSAPY